jgi:hypothetical protein
MSTDFINVLQLAAYMVLGTTGIVLIAAWLLKHFGSPKR